MNTLNVSPEFLSTSGQTWSEGTQVQGNCRMCNVRMRTGKRTKTLRNRKKQICDSAAGTTTRRTLGRQAAKQQVEEFQGALTTTICRYNGTGLSEW